MDVKTGDFGYDSGKNFNSEYQRNKSSRHGSFRNPHGYPQTQIRRSPEKIQNTFFERSKMNSMNRGEFSTQYSTKGRRKSNQYLPDLKPGNQSMITHSNSGMNSNGFSKNSMLDSNNAHLRSMSKDYNTSSFYKGSRGFINSRSKKYVNQYDKNIKSNKDKL